METWAPGITAIKHADLGDSPAAVNRETGVMYVNPSFKLNSDQWYFIMLHELGHIKQKTKNELEADAWAHKQYLKENKSLKQSVFALTDLLTFNKPEDYVRAKMQLQRAQAADGKTENFTGNMYTETYKYYGWDKCNPDYSTYFTGMKPVVLSDYEKKKSEYFVAEALGLASTLAGVFGAGPPEDKSTVGYDRFIQQKYAAEQAELQRQAAIVAQQKAAEQKKKNTYWIVGGVIVAVLIIGAAFLFLKK